jgi:hypothetical protein
MQFVPPKVDCLAEISKLRDAVILALQQQSLHSECIAVDVVTNTAAHCPKSRVMELLASVTSPVFVVLPKDHGLFMSKFIDAFKLILRKHFNKQFVASCQCLYYDNRYEVMTQSYVSVTFFMSLPFTPLPHMYRRACVRIGASFAQSTPCYLQCIQTTLSKSDERYVPPAKLIFQEMVTFALAELGFMVSPPVAERVLPVPVLSTPTTTPTSPLIHQQFEICTNVSTVMIDSGCETVCQRREHATLDLMLNTSAVCIEEVRVPVAACADERDQYTTKLAGVQRLAALTIKQLFYKPRRRKNKSEGSLMSVVHDSERLFARLITSLKSLKDLEACIIHDGSYYDAEPENIASGPFVCAYNMLFCKSDQEEVEWGRFHGEKEGKERGVPKGILDRVRIIKRCIPGQELLASSDSANFCPSTEKKEVLQHLFTACITSAYSCMSSSAVDKDVQSHIIGFHETFLDKFQEISKLAAIIVSHCIDASVEHTKAKSFRFMRDTIHHIVGGDVNSDAYASMVSICKALPELLESMKQTNNVLKVIANGCIQSIDSPVPTPPPPIPLVFQLLAKEL